MSIDWNKYDEYVLRGLPHRGYNGEPCICRECNEARSMGLELEQYEEIEERPTFTYPVQKPFLRRLFDKLAEQQKKPQPKEWYS